MKNVTGADERYKKAYSPQIGNKYHLRWAYSGCVWILDDIHSDDVHCWMHAKKSNKYIKAKLEDLRLLLPTAHNYKDH